MIDKYSYSTGSNLMSNLSNPSVFLLPLINSLKAEIQANGTGGTVQTRFQHLSVRPSTITRESGAALGYVSLRLLQVH